MSCTCQHEKPRLASREAFSAPLRALGYESHEVKSTLATHAGVYVTRYTAGPDGERWTTTPECEDVAYTETVLHRFDDAVVTALSEPLDAAQ